MRIKSVNCIVCDAGWRPWIFVRVETENGIIGYSEITDSHGSVKGLVSTVENLAEIIVGMDPLNINFILSKLYSKTKQTPFGLIQKAISGIENSLWDIKGKYLNKPVYDILGGMLRNSLEVYWSHCGTTRVRSADKVNKNKISTFKDLEKFCIDDLTNSGINYFKTNLIIFNENDNAHVHMPGFNFEQNMGDLNLSSTLEKKILTLLDLFHKNLPKNKKLLLDLNYNFNYPGLKELINKLNDYDLYWIEIDSQNHKTIKNITELSKNLIASGENLYTFSQYHPLITDTASDVVVIDVIWNGLIESLKIANYSNFFDIPVAPHNYYSHLSTNISLHFCSLVNNVKIMEVDIDDVPWKDEIVDEIPVIKDGRIYLNDKPGWGINLVEDQLKKYKWNG